MTQLLKKLSVFFSREDQIHLLYLLFLSLVVSLMEIVGISSLMPFIATISNPSLLVTNRYYIWVGQFLNVDNSKDFIIIFGILLLIFYLLRGGINVYFLYLSNKFTAKKTNFIREELFRSYTKLYYQDFVKKNSGFMMKNIMSEGGYITQMIASLLLMISETFTFFTLYGILLVMDWKVTVFTSITLGVFVFIMSNVIKRSIAESGELKSTLAGELTQVINETMGNLKIIKMTGSEELSINRFGLLGNRLSLSNTKYMTFIGAPKYLLETIGFMGIVAIIIYVFNSYEDPTIVLPVLSMFALALYRMLPSVNRILTGVNQIRYFKPSVNILYDELSQKSELVGTNEIKFNDIIKFTGVSFKFNSTTLVLNQINLEIKKGQKIAFIGESGSGKSTLVDLITGMYLPFTGSVKIDGQLLTMDKIKSWRKKIGYIPQSIYLFDGTVAENVVFHRSFDEKKLIQVLEKANIYDFLQTKEGLNTNVGDGGIQLSGGQKQRIAIARALYDDPEILVLDEATSALDYATEKKIMEEIYQASAGKTLLVIAHRLSTLKKCEIIYRLDNGVIMETRGVV
jgi:ATP-binding cassette, subfamily B, bacterial PglK